jgi:membrane-anchored protein YejM (alkaline phosphatase superfamily)
LNYRTFFISSHSLKWYRFDQFYAKANLNHLWYKERSGKPFFNDLGIDDHFTIEHLKKVIHQPSNRNFFGVVQLNSTHYPYKIPPNHMKWSGAFLDEYDNSIRYQDFVLGSLFDDLKRSGKLKNTVIIITSDHGESLKDHNNIGHVDSYYSEAISVPLMVYLPSSVRKKLDLTQFKKNLTATTSTIDIAPTILELLGLNTKEELNAIKANYTGFSLFQPIPKNRKVITMNNNETAKFKVGISVIGDGLHYIHRLNIVPNRAELYALSNDCQETENILPYYSRKKLKGYLSCLDPFEICKKYLP